MNPFGALAAGYASSRPAVHPLVLDKVRAYLGRKVRRALDVGCGSGVSTRPLELIAEERIGLEPAAAMLAFGAQVAPGARFVAAAAELLPVRDASIDVITAAGSLNYADTGRFFGEARRVLGPGGAVVVYDFSSGREFPDSPALAEWFLEFEARYPWPPSEGRALSPAILAAEAPGFALEHHEDFAETLRLTPEFYAGYVMTETNVAYAIRRGASHEEIRDWCGRSVEAVFGGVPRDVVFRGYIAYFRLTMTAVP